MWRHQHHESIGVAKASSGVASAAWRLASKKRAGVSINGIMHSRIALAAKSARARNLASRRAHRCAQRAASNGIS